MERGTNRMQKQYIESLWGGSSDRADRAEQSGAKTQSGIHAALKLPLASSPSRLALDTGAHD